MISVLIPVYNFKVTNLVICLANQLDEIGEAYEIIIAEDGSQKYIAQNKLLLKLDNVKIFHFEKNKGRSKTRNFLANKANYNWLLFLDADVLPVENNFIKLYLSNFNNDKNELIFSGGLKYKNSSKYAKNLRWKYGVKREELPKEKRQKLYNKVTLGANFIIHKSIFNKCSFNEQLLKYGYEDALFLQNLINEGYKISHINNPVFHLGLDTNEEYLAKTKDAIQNLNFLIEKEKFNGKQFQLIKIFDVLKKINLDIIVASFYKKFSSRIEGLLKDKFINVYLLDFYKLSYLCYLKNKQTK